MQVTYEAISPKNYWHLAMGSQQEDKFMERVFETITEGDVILDIGAHVGMYAVPFAKKTGKNGKVYAFEPESKGFDAIKRNAILNSLKNIIPLNMAISDREGDINFYVRPDKDTHSIFEKTLAPSPLGIQETIAIKTMSVDHMVEAGVVLEPNFVKIDVEGAELKVLDGMSHTSKRIKHILVEIHERALSLEGIQNPKEEVELRLKTLGFTKIEYLDDIHVMASK
jgi:FkbM family methyltransferase